MERLTPLSAAFLQAEDEDATTTMAIASAAVFEGPVPSHQEFVAHIAGRLPLVPRFRQKVRTVPFDLGAPVWVDDPATDVGWHVRRTALPAPGGDAELFALVGRVMSARMDRSRPLWEYWVAEGLADGRWALLQKVHHCMVDGISGTALYDLIFDAGPEPRPAVQDRWQPEPAPSTLSLTASAARDLALAPIDVARTAGSLLRSPRTLARRTRQTAQGAVALSTAALPVASTSLRGRMGRQRRYTATTVPLAQVKQVSRTFDASINDVALAAISGGFRALLVSRGEEPHRHAVRTLVPVSARQPGEESIADNRVTLMLPYLPVDVSDPVARLAAVGERIDEAVAAHTPEAGVSLTSFAEHNAFLPVALGVRLAFHIPQRQLVTVTTNVPGPRRAVYALGRRCERIVPYVPIADRVRLGVAIFSYVGDLAFGVTGDFDTVPDIDVFATGVRRSVDELVAATESVG